MTLEATKLYAVHVLVWNLIPTWAEDGLFGLGVWGELCGVDDHGPAHGGDCAPPQREEPLLADDEEEGVKDVLVVANTDL